MAVIVPGLFATMLLLAAPEIGTRITRFLDFQDRSWINRAHVYTVAVRLVMERPLSGWGIGAFNTLYNRFYRLPSEAYSFYDVHSSVMHFFTLYGLAGVLLWVNFALGGRWSLAFLRRVSHPTLLSMVGAGALLLTDSPGASSAATFPLLSLGACALIELRAASCRSGEVISPPRLRLTLVLTGLYLLGFAFPVVGPDERFHQSLRDAFRGTGGRCTYVVQNLQRGCEQMWCLNEDLALWAGTAGHLGAIDAAARAGGEKDEVSSPPLAAATSRAPSAEDIRLALQLFDPSAVARCIASAPARDFCAQKQYDGKDMVLEFPQEEAPMITRSLDKANVPPVSLRDRFELTTDDMSESWKISAKQMHRMFATARQTDHPAKHIVHEALLRSKFKYGVLAWLPARATSWGFASHGPITHVEAAEVQHASTHYQVTVIRHEAIPRLGIRQPVFDSFARFGHLVWLYLGSDS